MRMKRVAGLLLLLIALEKSSLCQAKNTAAKDIGHSFDRTTFQAGYDAVWQTLLSVLGEYQFQFVVKDAGAGRIETGYVTISRHPLLSKPSNGVKAYAIPPRLFLRKWLDGRVKLNASLNRLSDTSTQVILRPDIDGLASTRFDDTSVTGEWRKCQSNGKFESELFRQMGEELREHDQPANAGPAPSPPKPSSEGAKEDEKKGKAKSNLMLQSAPEGAEIYLNSKLVGMTPARLSLAPGEYRVSIRKDGYKEFQRVFVILESSDLTISKELEKQ